MPITPAVTDGWRRSSRMFHVASVALGPLFLASLVGAMGSVLQFFPPSHAPWWPQSRLDLLDSELGGLLAVGACALSLQAPLVLFAALAVSAGAMLHILLVVEPGLPDEGPGQGPSVISTGARLKLPGRRRAIAGRLHLSRTSLIFMPNRWRRSTGGGASSEPVLIPLSDITNLKGPKRWGVPPPLHIVRRSGETTPLAVSNADEVRQWIAEVSEGKTPAAALPGHRRWRRWSLAIAGITMLLIVVGWHVGVRLVAAREYARIRAEGFPVTLTEAQAGYSFPKGENAAPIYIKAASSLVRQPTVEDRLPWLCRSGEVLMPAPGEPIPSDMKAAMEAFLAPNGEALALVRRASGVVESRYPIDLMLGEDIRLDHLYGVRMLAISLRFSVDLAAERRDNDAAVGLVLDLLALKRSLSREPTVMSFLVGVFVEHSALEALEGCFPRVRFTEPQLAALADRLRAHAAMNSGELAVAGNRCAKLALVDEPSRLLKYLGGISSKPSDGAGLPLVALYLCSGLRDLDRLIFLQRVDGTMRRLRLPTAAPEPDEEHLRTRLFISDLLGFDEVAISIASRHSRVHLLLAQAGIAAKRHQLAHGSLPDRLEQVVPEFLDELPRDLFDGEPLRYKRTERGAVIYSVGKDLKDNGGKRNWQPRRYDPDAVDVDIVSEILEKP